VPLGSFGAAEREHRTNLMAGKLSPTMTVREFANGYWYVDELRGSPVRSVFPWPRGCERMRSNEP
jgi:hypothetical protein